MPTGSDYATSRKAGVVKAPDADLATRVQRMAVRQRTVQAQQSAANRARFPEFTAWLDAFSEQFGRCSVRFLHDTASGYTAGKPMPPCVPFTDERDLKRG